MAGFIDKKTFEHNGYKYIESVNEQYIFRRQTGLKIETVKASREDVETGRVYKMMDSGFSRV